LKRKERFAVTFQEYFAQIKERFAGADITGIADPTRIQIDITGEAAGTFYVEIKGGNLAVEPYEYHDRDVLLTISDENFLKIINGKLDPVAAFTFGKLKAQGDLGKALELKKLLKN
jgi:putative sterol carrier protein